MRHVLLCLTARNNRESSFHHCGGPVKLVQACLRARKSLESSFHRYGGPAARASVFMCGKDLTKPF